MLKLRTYLRVILINTGILYINKNEKYNVPIFGYFIGITNITFNFELYM